MAFKMFAWVPDGTYDYEEFMCRYVVLNGNPQIVISKMWVDTGGPNDVDDSLKVAWGSFPNFPPKPPKK